MPGRPVVHRVDSDWAEGEGRLLAGSIVGLPEDEVCSAFFVVVHHCADGSHEFRFAVDPGCGPEITAATLRHAADHIHGGCGYCRRHNRRARRADSQ